MQQDLTVMFTSLIEDFAKIQEANCNQQYRDRNDFVRLYIALWGGSWVIMNGGSKWQGSD
ncbi:MAG: hypothetical protein ACQEXV_16520 [Bacillota bacterium]